MQVKSLRLIAMMLIVFASMTAKANPVDMRTAREVAMKFVNANAKVPLRSAEDLQLVTTYSISRGDAAFHIFNTPNGFIIVAADDCATPILGYSDEGRPFNLDNIPIQLQGYLQGFVEQIEYGIENQLEADEKTAEQWAMLRRTGRMKEDLSVDPFMEKMKGTKMVRLSSRKDRDGIDMQNRYETIDIDDLDPDDAAKIVKPTLPKSRSNGAVEPLITAHWDQGCYYNAMCPEDEGGTCGHVPTGCVATAMGMIMHYWGYPAQGTGTHSYTPNGYPEQTVNFGETTYNWDNMPDQLDANSTQAQIDAVSTLLWHCGVAVEMAYNTTSSGALDESIPNAFHNYFGYSGFGYCNDAIYRFKEDNVTWMTEVKACLNMGRPLLYFATDTDGLGSHAFVCDGYNTDDQLHFNWGWGGNGNGYFVVDALNVEGYQFNDDVHALFGILPPNEFQLRYNIIEGGVEVTYEQPELYTSSYFAYPDTIVIPSQVSINGTSYPVIAIGDKAFQCCFSLRKVVVPNSVKSIGEFAFYSSGQLPMMEVELSDSITIIKRSAFTGAGIRSIDLPNTLTTIEPEALSWTQITSLTIPRSLTAVGHSLTAFSPIYTLNWYADSCMWTEEFISGIAFGASIINIGEFVKYIPEYLFSNCGITSIWLPDSLVSIGIGCFYNCDNLTSITIPQNIKYVGNDAFDDCSSLVTVNFNAKRCEYAPYLFERCGNLETINFGDSVGVVPGNLCVDILYTPSITTVNFGSSIDTIDYYAFMGCSNITSITLPSSIKHIEYGAFGNCNQLNTVNMTAVTNPPSLGVWGPFDGNAENRKFLIPCESYESFYNAEGWYYHDGGGNTFFDYDYRIDLKSVPETEIQMTAISDDTIQGRVVFYKNASVCDSTTVYFAQPSFGYHFDHWSNGSITNPDTLLLTSDTSVIAYFAKDQFHVDGTAAASVFFSNFEQPENDTLWTLKNEEYVNRWFIDDLDSTRALFISNDNGITNSYVNENAHSYVFAYHPLQLVAGDYFCSFDWRAEGHGFDGQFSLNFGSEDCLFAFLYQGEIDSIPLYYYGGSPELCYGYDLGNYLINSLFFYDMFGQHSFNRKSLNINVPSEGEYNLLFYWRNGRTPDMGGEQEPNGYPAAIDNVVFYSLDPSRGYITGEETVDYLDTVTLTAVPNPGYRFVCWYDGDTNITKQVVAINNLTCVALFEIDPDNPPVLQSYELSQGWNWWAPTVETSVEAVQAALQGKVIQIQSQEGEADGYIYPGEMLKIETNETCTLSVNGIPAGSVTVSIAPGPNWFGFVGTEKTVEAAFTSFTASEGDKIISQDEGFAVFEDGEWHGTLENLQPGKGYVYISNATAQKELVIGE